MRKRAAIIISAVFLMIGPGIVSAQEWQQSVEESGLRIAQTSSAGQTPNGQTQTKLILRCRSGRDGAISLIYRVNGVDKIKGFNFDDFEGPDASVRNRKLTTFIVQSSEGTIEVNTAVGGYYSGEETNSFDFEFSAPNNSRGNLRKLTNAMMNGATKIVVRVEDSKDKHKFLQTEFPTAESAKAVSEAMKGLN